METSVLVAIVTAFAGRVDLLFILIVLIGAGWMFYKLASRGIINISDQFKNILDNQSKIISEIQTDIKELREVVIDVKIIQKDVENLKEDVEDLKDKYPIKRSNR